MISLFKVTDFAHLVRLGPNRDGGYVLPAGALEEARALMSYGVGDDSGFDEDFVQSTGKPAFLFDHTISRPEFHSSDKLLNFYPEGLGRKLFCREPWDHMTRLKIPGPVVLKIDVELDEYSYFEQQDISELADMAVCIVVEIHDIDKHEERFTEMMCRLYRAYTLACVQPNNCDPLVLVRGNTIPRTAEFTLVHNDVASRLEQGPYAGTQVLFHRNDPHMPPLDISHLTHPGVPA